MTDTVYLILMRSRVSPTARWRVTDFWPRYETRAFADETADVLQKQYPESLFRVVEVDNHDDQTHRDLDGSGSSG